MGTGMSMAGATLSDIAIVLVSIVIGQHPICKVMSHNDLLPPLVLRIGLIILCACAVLIV